MRHAALLCLVTASLLGGTSVAAADQCAFNARPVAERALALVKPGSTVLQFCEPCGDVLSKMQPVVVKTISIDTRHHQVIVNGDDVDLAYLFVKTSPTKFENVGIATQCGARYVSATIDGGKPSGRTSQPHGPRPPAPPPPPRATSIDELAGTWSVRVNTRFSSCASKRGTVTATWKIQVANGAVAIKTDDGLELAGSPDTSNTKIIKTELAPRKQPSSVGAEITLLWKDRFFGQIVRAERRRSPGDPVCVVHQQVTGTRQP